MLYKVQDLVLHVINIYIMNINVIINIYYEYKCNFKCNIAKVIRLKAVSNKI